jgi:hypothetical protein
VSIVVVRIVVIVMMVVVVRIVMIAVIGVVVLFVALGRMLFVMFAGMGFVVLARVLFVMFAGMRLVMFAGMSFVVLARMFFVMSLVVVFMVLGMMLLVSFVSSAVRPAVAATAATMAGRYPAEGDHQTNCQDRYENTACYGHNVPLVNEVSKTVFAKMRWCPLAPNCHGATPKTSIDYA